MMIYILTQIYNYYQIQKIHPEVTERMDQAFSSIAQTQNCILHTPRKREGLFLFAAGDEQKNDPRRISDIIFQVHKILTNNRKNLYGFNTIVSIQKISPPLQVITRLKINLYLLDEEEYVWISRAEVPFFTKCLTFEKKGNFMKISMKHEPLNDRLSNNKNKFWLRKSSYNQVFDEITPIINGIEKNKIIYMYGGNGRGKTTIALSIVQSVLGEDHKYVPRMYTLFKRQSCVHPFLNSIHLGFLQKIPSYLKEHEKQIWSSQGRLLSYLKSGNEEHYCPDHLYEDFLICYNIYLTAYIRMMEARLKPAFFICDDCDGYTGQTHSGLFLLLTDFLQNSSFIPIFISREEELPSPYASLSAKKIHVKPINQREVKKIVQTLYPGIKITKKITKKILEYSKDQILPVKNYCAYCAAKGIIKKGKSSYKGDIEKSNELIQSSSQSHILISLIQSIKQNELDLLYYIYISAGMLNRRGLLAFLEHNEYERRYVQDVIENLSHEGLVIPGDYITPYYPGLKKQIEEILQSRTHYLNDVYLKYIIEHWKEKKFNRLVLLFSLFISYKKTDLALEVLYSLVKRKIDEEKIQDVKPFISEKNPAITYPLAEEEKKQLLMIIKAAQLRIALLEENEEKNRTLVKNIEEELTSIDTVSVYRGDIYLGIASYYKIIGESNIAVKYTKKALLDYQDLGLREKKAHAYIRLGAIMLGEEKIKDAHEYLLLSLHLFPEEFKYPHNKIQILILTGISFYLQGNISKAFQQSKELLALSRKVGKRNWELLSIFFAGRIYFDLGLYEDAQVQFLQCLTLTTVYGIKEARKVLVAWLGRSYVYSGKIKEGLKTLNLVKADKEIYFFLAEAYFFLKQYNKSLIFTERSISLQISYPQIPDEKIDWSSGFTLIEERYSKQSNKGIIFNRMLQVFRAYLLSHCRGLKEGIIEFYNILRTGKDHKIDPYYSFYYFLYAQLLQKSGEDETDDYLTILNKSLKQLQERASKIEVPSDRTKYLFNNFWNNHIFNEAKKKNLI